MNTARTSKQSSAVTVPAMLRKLRDANRSDWIIVKRCNDMIAMIKNLRKIEEREYKGRCDEETAMELRKNLAVAMKWLAKWAQDRAN